MGGKNTLFSSREEIEEIRNSTPDKQARDERDARSWELMHPKSGDEVNDVRIPFHRFHSFLAGRAGHVPESRIAELEKLVEAIKPLANIWTMYLENRLDEARPEWGDDKEMDLDTGLFFGRGGSTVIKLKDAKFAYDCLAKGPGAWKAAYRNDWLDEICSNMKKEPK